MTDDHQYFNGWAAAYILGALDGQDRRDFELHLSQCRACTGEVNEFAPLPSLLAKVDPAAIDHTPSVGLQERITTAARSELSTLRRRHHIWRAAAVASTAAAAVLAGLLLLNRDTTVAPPQQATTIISSTAAETNVSVIPKGWGTEIVLNIADLPYRDGYQLWTVDAGGSWTNAATWSPTPSGGVRLTGASRVPLEDVERIVITSLDTEDVLVEASG
ncbi:MAG: zf-HC2 domain-containing protein [Acidimicrobiia bacterium]|nr:zf-HC2 domain-containing protein [Acidimicrobiia bacterium]